MKLEELTLEQWQQMLLDISEIKRDGTPLAIGNVTNTQFSIARHYGGIKYNGQTFTYFPSVDCLFRDDFLKFAKQKIKKWNNKHEGEK